MRLKKNVRMTLLYLAFVVIGVVMVFPFIWMIATFFKTGTDIYSLSLLPKNSHWIIIAKCLLDRIFPDGF